jgi:hypothetical protein
LPWLRRDKICGKGCSEIYWGEWYSDPPDCCDPCDQCHGCWTGPHGYCHLGPCQRLLACFHGFTYCPPPCCGPSCGLCDKPGCGGCGTCGVGRAAGCATCSHHGGYAGEFSDHAPHSLMEENWDLPPGPKPVPGKPIHKAQGVPEPRMTHVPAPQRPAAMQTAAPAANRMPATSNRMVRHAAYQR